MRVATQEELRAGLADFVRNCVDSKRQDRFLGFLQTKKGVKKWLEQLDHFQNYLDISIASQLASNLTTLEIIDKFKLSPKSDMLIFSVVRDMQSVIGPLDFAIEAIYQSGRGTILCSMNSKPSYWFYLGEEPHAQYFFAAE